MSLPLANRYARVKALLTKLESRKKELEAQILESQNKNGCVIGHNLMLVVRSIQRTDYSVSILKEHATPDVLEQAKRITTYNRFDIKPIEEQKVA